MILKPVNGALQIFYYHDPQMTLTYFMTRSAEFAYSRSHVSLYRTIGPLVILPLTKVDLQYDTTRMYAPMICLFVLDDSLLS